MKVLLSIVLLVCAGGCEIHRTIGLTQDPAALVEGSVVIPFTPKDKVDLLFMIDNSPSTTPKQTELKNRIPTLVQKLDDFAAKGTPASYHIGVVTSDLGAGQITIGSGAQCHPGGDGGKLQAVGVAADPTCQAPTGGKRFIDLDQRDGTSNLPTGQDLAKTFGCMASVGSYGCGFEAPLESVYRALHDPIPENDGFLRPDALLVVVFLTDEDDCSVNPDTDLFDPGKIALYGVEHSYRCTRFGLVCDGGLPPDADTGGPLTNCRPATQADGGKLIDVQKYLNFFGQPATKGGVKANPNDVILAAIAAPATPVAVRFTTPCADGSAPSCAVLAHSCVAADNPEFYGDPAVRLHAVVDTNARNVSGSICDTDYTPVVDRIGDAIGQLETAVGCLPAPLLDPTRPACQISGSDALPAEVPSCVASGGTAPCWRITTDASCQALINPKDSTPEQLRLIVDRGGLSGTVLATCALVTGAP